MSIKSNKEGDASLLKYIYRERIWNTRTYPIYNIHGEVNPHISNWTSLVTYLFYKYGSIGGGNDWISKQ